MEEIANLSLLDISMSPLVVESVNVYGKRVETELPSLRLLPPYEKRLAKTVISSLYDLKNGLWNVAPEDQPVDKLFKSVMGLKDKDGVGYVYAMKRVDQLMKLNNNGAVRLGKLESLIKDKLASNPAATSIYLTKYPGVGGLPGVVFVMGGPMVCSVGLEQDERFSPYKHKYLQCCCFCSKYPVINKDLVYLIESNVCVLKFAVGSVHTACLIEKGVKVEFYHDADGVPRFPTRMLSPIFGDDDAVDVVESGLKAVKKEKEDVSTSDSDSDESLGCGILWPDDRFDDFGESIKIMGV